MSVTVLSLVFVSCEKELVPYNDPTCRVNFQYMGGGYTTEDLENNYGDSDSYSTTTFSFIYDGNGTDRDTLWFDVGVSGFLYDYPRAIGVEQLTVPDSVGVNAKPGVHYVAFDDPEVASFYSVPTNRSYAQIPVILLRDPSLEQGDVMLRFGFVPNEYFVPGFSKMSYRTIHIIGRLEEPSYWLDWIFGVWGPVKHQLMIDWTGDKWDTDYNYDFAFMETAYQDYIHDVLTRKLEEENQKRIDAGLDVYKEADGTPVDFTPVEEY